MCSGDGGSDIGGELGKDGVSGRGFARRRRLRPLPEEDLNPSRDRGRGRSEMREEFDDKMAESIDATSALLMDAIDVETSDKKLPALPPAEGGGVRQDGILTFSRFAAPQQ